MPRFTTPIQKEVDDQVEQLHQNMIKEQNRVMYQNLEMFLDCLVNLINEGNEKHFSAEKTLELIEGMINTQKKLIDMRRND